MGGTPVHDVIQQLSPYCRAEYCTVSSSVCLWVQHCLDTGGAYSCVLLVFDVCSWHWARQGKVGFLQNATCVALVPLLTGQPSWVMTDGA